MSINSQRAAILLLVLLELFQKSNSEESLVAIYKKVDDRRNLTHVCDGGLIHPEWVITSDNCKDNYEIFSPGVYYVSVKNQYNQIFSRLVKSWNTEFYDKESEFVSIALLHLEYEFESDDNIIPVRVASEETLAQKYPKDIYRRCSFKSWNSEDGLPVEKTMSEVSFRNCANTNQYIKLYMCSEESEDWLDSKYGGPLVCENLQVAVYVGSSQEGFKKLLFVKLDVPYILTMIPSYKLANLFETVPIERWDGSGGSSTQFNTLLCSVCLISNYVCSRI